MTSSPLSPLSRELERLSIDPPPGHQPEPDSPARATAQASGPIASLPGQGLPPAEMELDDVLAKMEAIFQIPDDPVAAGDASAADELAGQSGSSRRLHALREVRASLDQLWRSRSHLLPAASELLANRSRDVQWRDPLRESAVLDFFLLVVATPEVSAAQMLQSLRLIGNCCAENHSNRMRVVERDSVEAIVGQLEHGSLLHVAVPVLYNLCIDCEPAQVRAGQSGAIAKLLALLSNHDSALRTDATLGGYGCRLLELIASSPAGLDRSPDDAASSLCQLALEVDGDVEDMISLINAAVAHLNQPGCQRYMLRRRLLKLVLRTLVKTYSPPSSPDPGADSPADLMRPPPFEPSLTGDEAVLLADTRRHLVDVLSDISALDDFADAYPLDSALVGSLRVWLTVRQAQLQVCACIMLGNLARADGPCQVMVHDFHLEEALMALLRHSDDEHVMHAAASFLKNLALPSGNKEALGRAGLVEAMSRLWALDAMPQCQYLAACVTRQAVSGSLANIQRLLTPLSADPDSPAHNRTYLSLLLLLHGRTDRWPTRTEVARTTAAICRVLNGPRPGAPSEQVRATVERLYSLHPDVARPAVNLACYSRSAAARSEGWFACALMASTAEGASAVNNATASLDTLRPLVEVITGRSLGGTPAEEQAPTEPGGEEAPQTSEMKRADRENALILVSNLLKHKGETMPELRRHVLEDLLQGNPTSPTVQESLADIF